MGTCEEAHSELRGQYTALQAAHEEVVDERASLQAQLDAAQAKQVASVKAYQVWRAWTQQTAITRGTEELASANAEHRAAASAAALKQA